MAAELPTGTLTFLFTDIEGSVRLWERHPEAMKRAHARHFDLIAGCVEQHGGSVVRDRGEGDSVFAVFPRAPDALAAACCLQLALAREPWPDQMPPPRVRAALHTGEAHQHQGDYNSSAVNRCARLRAIAHGGQTLVSEATCEWVGDAPLPSGASLEDVGWHRLKDLERPEHVWQLRHPNLPGDFPPLRSLDARRTNLPQQLSSFVGRQRELAAVRERLAAPGTRLLTLTGTGGTGKTRLCLQVAADVAQDYADGGVWLVDLAPLADPALVEPAAAAALGVREEAGRPLAQTLADQLRPQNTLILLDNCEHLVEACARLAHYLLRECPRLRILATSREPLEVEGEVLWRVPSLRLPGEGVSEDEDALVESDAVRLFAERARRHRPEFGLDARNAPLVADVCRRLDGIPLAIELAATRVRTLSLEQIAARLGNRLDLLTGGSRTAPPRHQTLRAALDWSYDLLGAAESALLPRLSVFAGGWTLEAAEAICETDEETNEEISAGTVLDVLSRLADRSLVLVEPGQPAGEAAARFRLQETVRQYAAERLGTKTQAAARLRDRHRDWFLALAEAAEPQLRGPEQAEWLRRLETEHDNLRAALAHSLSDKTGPRLANALYSFWYVRGYLSEGRRWFEQALSRTDDGSGTAGVDAATQARALTRLGVLARLQGDYAAARRCCEQGLALRRTLGDEPAIADSLTSLGHVARELGDHEAAGQHHAESLAICRRANDRARIVMSLINLGGVAIARGDCTAASALLRESLVISREMGDLFRTATALHNLAEVSEKLGRFEEAADLFEQSLAIRQNLSDKRGVAFSLTCLGMVAVRQGRCEPAALLLGAAEAAREAVEAPLPPSDRAEYERAVAILRGALGPEKLAALWARGKVRPEV